MRANHLEEYMETQQKGLLDNWWRKGLPTEKGVYWLYSYRYGKTSCGYEQKPELHMLEVWNDAVKNPMYVADGQILYESEVEEPYWRPLRIPNLPDERNTINENNNYKNERLD